MTTILIIFIIGLVITITTIQILNTNYSTSKDRYFISGGYDRRSSWSDVPNGERGASVPNKNNDIFLPTGSVINYSRLYKWFYGWFLCEDIYSEKWMNLHFWHVDWVNILKVDEGFVTMAVNLRISGGLNTSPTATVKGSGIFCFYGHDAVFRTKTYTIDNDLTLNFNKESAKLGPKPKYFTK